MKIKIVRIIIASMNTFPATIDLNPSGGHPEASIIWLHGLGADGNDFVPIAEQLRLAEHLKVRFVFPHAPVRSITVNNGMSMRAWYDIFELELARREDQEGIQSSTQLITSLIEREVTLGIPTQRIVLAGFSQGGAMALHAGLRYPKPLGGIIALSSYLLLVEDFAKKRHPANQLTPIFIAHGLFDPIVPLMLGEMCRQQLQGLDYLVDWHSYPMPHSVLPQEILDISRFLTKVLEVTPPT